jgi:hypothetical protein
MRQCDLSDEAFRSSALGFSSYKRLIMTRSSASPTMYLSLTPTGIMQHFNGVRMEQTLRSISPVLRAGLNLMKMIS